jgi:hypothetical protein
MAEPRMLRRVPHNNMSDAERFNYWSRPHESGCILWGNTIDTSGYGVIRVRGRTELAHRFAWKIANGPIPDGMCVCHTCDVRACVNVDHLWIGTIADNNMDAIQKGRNVILMGELNGMAKLTAEKVIAIRADTRKQRIIAAEYGVSQKIISCVKTRRGWGHI